VKDKGIFYLYCMALGVPIPKLYAILFKAAPGWSHNGSALVSREDWKRFLDLQLPSEFVVKPATGAHGAGVGIFRKTDKGLVDACGNPCEAEGLYDTMRSDPEYDSFVVQERVRSHPEMERLSGTESVQTIRLITVAAPHRRCRILHANLRVIVDDSVVDTCPYACPSGSQVITRAGICLDDGSLQAGKQIRGMRAAMETLSVHPRTGVRFEGFRLPFWAETCRVVKAAAPRFLPLRAIGWDVALTPRGPCVVEANNWWDPPNLLRCADAVVAGLSALTR
jgi:hypothetical protein